METLWQIQNATDDWYRQVFINGEFIDGPRLPSGICSKCGQFASFGYLPFECPPEIRSEIEELSAKGGALPVAEFRERARVWQAVLRKKGLKAELEPGMSFLPIRWRIPSTPRYDLFWPLIGIAVSDRLRKVFEDNRATGVTFYYPLVLGPVGRAAPTAKNVVPKNLEFDDEYYRSIQRIADPARLGTFFKLGLPTVIPSTEVTVTDCSECGSGDWDFYAPQPERDRQRQHSILLKKYVPDTDIFRSHVYDGFLVRDRIKRCIPDAYLRNCAVAPIQIAE